MTTIPSTEIGETIDSNVSFAAKTPVRRTARRLLAIVAVVLIAPVGLWILTRSSAPLDGGNSSIRYTVLPRSFDVVLREKGELQAAKSTDIKCEVEGRATIISLIEEGAEVKEGDLLVELASDEIDDRILQEELKEANAIMAYEAAKTALDIQLDKNASDTRKALLEIELKQLELEKYVSGDWVQKLTDAGIAIEEAQITRDRRREDFEAAEKLLPKQYITRTEYNEDEFNFHKAKWGVTKALLAKEVLEKYTHVADLRRRNSDVEEAVKDAERTKKDAEGQEDNKRRILEGKKKELELIQDQLAKLRVQRTKCRITAPTKGFVVYYSGGGRHWGSSDNQIKEGATVHERQILMQLPDTSEMIVQLRVHEAKTDRLSLGQRALIEIEGVPGETFTGTVTKIAVVADTQNRWLNPDLKEYESEVTLDPTDIPLKPGATAHAQIMVEHIENQLAVPVQAIYARGGNRYVFRTNGTTAQPVPVTLGAVGTEFVEITDGVTKGEQILLAFSDEHRRLIAELPSDREGGPRHAGRPGGHRRGPGSTGSVKHGVQRGRQTAKGKPHTKASATK